MPKTLEEKVKEQQIEVAEYRKMTDSPIYFVQKVWGLTPQPILKEFLPRLSLGLRLTGKDWDKFCATVRPEWFAPFDEGKHMTWQQYLVLAGIEKAILGQAPWRISIVSGHGIGKTALLSWITLWFLFVHPMAKSATTSPSKEQMYDVLWSELKKWIDRMPPMVAQFYEWETQHIRMKEAPQEWFARAKTSSKENSEALAGIHGPWVMAAADEASGVEEPIFETMDGSLTGEHILVFLIGNGTRNTGYFYASHRKEEKAKFWQCFSFNAEESPRVTKESVQKWKDEYGEESVQYNVRVKGLFPDEGQMDDKGFVQLLNENDLHFVPYNHEWRPVGRVIGALDASGEGQDEAAWAGRNRQIAHVLFTEKTSNDKGMASTSVTLCDKFQIDPIDFVIDAFGKGANVSQEIALMTSQEKRPWRVTPVNVGDPCDDESEREFYINKRAEMFYKLMLWVRAGGQFMECALPEETKRFKEELLSIRFKRTGSGRVQIMDKVMMKKLGLKSPNKADAVAMTFLRPDGAKRSTWGDPISVTGEGSNAQFDAFSPLGD